MTHHGPASGRLLRVLVVGLVTCIVIVVGTGVFNLALGLEDKEQWMFFGGAGILAVMFAVMTTAALVIRRGRLVPMMALAVTAVVVGTALTLYLIANTGSYSETDEALTQLATASMLTGVGLAYTGVYVLIRTHSKLVLVLKILTLVCGWLAVTLIASMTYLDAMVNNWVFALVLVVTTSTLVLVTLIGTVVVPLAAHGGRERAPVESIGQRIRIELACPRCGKRQEVPTGNPRCGRCRAWLLVDVEEPRCECGYLLYQLRGDVCPECGRSTPPDMRWQALRAPTTAG